MSYDINNKIGAGFSICPSCKSDDWKSAKMIAMSSITKTSGSVSGSASGTSSDPSLFSGNFLTADRWFSKKSTVDMNVVLDVNLTTTNGLLHEVKLLMLSYDSITQIPEKPEVPIRPKGIGFFEKITPVDPVMPMPIAPKKAQPPNTPINRSWYIDYKEIVIFSSKFSILIAIAIAFYNNYDFKGGGIIGICLWGCMIVLGLPVSCFQNEWRQKKYERSIKKIERNYERDIKNYEKASQLYTQKFEQYKMKCEQANAQQKAEFDSFCLYREKCIEYDQKYLLFIAQKNEVMKIREILWHRARICMRCGTAYIAP